jgi:hypothetical protein
MVKKGNIPFLPLPAATAVDFERSLLESAAVFVVFLPSRRDVGRSLGGTEGCLRHSCATTLLAAAYFPRGKASSSTVLTALSDGDDDDDDSAGGADGCG